MQLIYDTDNPEYDHDLEATTDECGIAALKHLGIENVAANFIMSVLHDQYQDYAAVTILDSDRSKNLDYVHFLIVRESTLEIMVSITRGTSMDQAGLGADGKDLPFVEK